MTQTEAITLIRQLLNDNSFIPALTIHQPYASLLACEAKLYETRGWETKFRGWMLIHASAKPTVKTLCDYGIPVDTAITMQNALGIDIPKFYGLPTGQIIAIAELVNCWRMVYNPGTDIDVAKHIEIGAELDVPRKHPDFHRFIVPTENELLFGDWRPDRYAWETRNMTMLDTPIKVAGKQKLWRWRGEGL